MRVHQHNGWLLLILLSVICHEGMCQGGGGGGDGGGGDPCSPNPCEHGGMCNKRDGGDFNCDCPPGYSGKTCENGDNPCEPNPCRNGGTCLIRDTGGYECDCTNSWEGPTCETSRNPCENYCENGGTCYIDTSTNQRECNCREGWKGQRCDVEDPCLPNPCYNGGSCRSGSSNSFNCDCRSGFAGDQCETVLSQSDPCDPDPCVHGDCRHRSQSTNGYVCDCDHGYNGTHCDNDKEKPEINCPPSKTLQLDTGQSSRVINWPTPQTSDNSQGVVIVTCTPPTGTTFYVGEDTVWCEATDESDNTETCHFDIIISEGAVPQITCHDEITAPAAPGKAYATITYPPPGLVNADSHTCWPQSGTNFNIGDTEVTCEAWKGGVKASCTFNIFVQDNQDPDITCSDDVEMATAYRADNNQVWWSNPTVTDNSRMYEWWCNYEAGDVFYLGSEEVTCTAIDNHDNTASCSFSVAIIDEEPPTITCPSRQTGSTDWMTNVKSIWYTVDWDDNASDVTIDCDYPSGSSFSIGTTRVECVATDQSDNTKQCSFDVVISDGEAPSMECPLDISVTRTNGVGGATVQWTLLVHDNSGIEPTTQCNPSQSQVFQFGQTTVTCSARDVAGNTDTCQFTVEVTDFEVPTISCPPDIVVPTDRGQKSATVPWELPTTGADDGVSFECYPSSGDTLDIGEYRVQCYATSPDGVKSGCDFTVEVEDREPPVIQCPSNQIAVSPDGNAIKTTYSDRPSYVDNSEIDWFTLSCDPNLDYTEFEVGIWDITCYVEDLGGNEARCTFTVQVVLGGTDVCSGNPCGANGECVSGTNSVSCQCDEGWTGATCQIRDDPKTTTPSNRGDGNNGGDGTNDPQTSGSVGTIVGAVVGVIILILVLVVAIVCFIRCRRAPRRALPMSKHVATPRHGHHHQKPTNGNIPLTTKSPAKSVSGNSVFDNAAYNSVGDRRYERVAHPTTPPNNVQGPPGLGVPSTTYAPPSPRMTGSKPPSSPRITAKAPPSPRPQSTAASMKPPSSPYTTSKASPGPRPMSSPRINARAPPSSRPQSTPGSLKPPSSNPYPNSKSPKSPRHKAESRQQSSAPHAKSNNPRNSASPTKNTNHKGKKIPPRVPSMPASAMYGRGAIGGANSAPYETYLTPMPSARGTDHSSHVYEEIDDDRSAQRGGRNPSHYSEAYSEMGKADSGYMEFN